MGLLKRWAARIRSRVRSARPRTRWLAVLAAGLVVVGAVWTALEVGDGQPPWTAVGDRTLSAADVDAAGDLAAQRGIPHRVESGRLLVPAPRAAEAREAMKAEGLLGRQPPPSLAEFTATGSIWESPAEKTRRWQCAVMGTLSRSIGQLPGVRRAVVLFDPGAPRGFGRPAVPPTAAVKVAMTDGGRLGPKLALAVADLVSGSVAGMDRTCVHVVDNTGRSYRFDAEGVVGPDDPVERLREAEGYLREKIVEALGHIDNVIVGVSVTDEHLLGGRRSASVRVPRSYLAAVYRAAHNASDDPTGAAFESFAGRELAKTRESVLSVAGIEDANAVKVDWYYDVLPAPTGAGDVKGGMPPGGRTLASALLVLLGVVSGLAAVRRRRRAAAEAAERAAPPAGAAEGAGNVEETSCDHPFEMLEQASAEELGLLLRGEHLQTIALILSHVAPPTAAEVLGAFERDRQIEISRRIAALAAVDGDVVAEAVRGLLSRRRMGPEGEGDQAGGVGKVAKILHHAGYATEQAVLDGLRGAEPALAESIRKRMFVFEDVSELPRDMLGGALESLGSDELAVALRTAGKEVKEKILSALSRDAAREVRAGMERIGPVRLSDVEAAQERVVSAVRRLEAGRYVSADDRKAGGVLA